MHPSKFLSLLCAGIFLASATHGFAAKGGGGSEGFGTIIGTYDGTVTYSDPSVGLGPIQFPAQIVIKNQGKGTRASVTVEGSFPATFGPAALYPFSIRLALKKGSVSGDVSGQVITTTVGKGTYKLKKRKLTLSLQTLTALTLSSNPAVGGIFTIPVVAAFSKNGVSVTALPTDDLGFSWGTVEFSGSKKKSKKVK